MPEANSEHRNETVTKQIWWEFRLNLERSNQIRHIKKKFLFPNVQFRMDWLNDATTVQTARMRSIQIMSAKFGENHGVAILRFTKTKGRQTLLDERRFDFRMELTQHEDAIRRKMKSMQSQLSIERILSPVSSLVCTGVTDFDWFNRRMPSHGPWQWSCRKSKKKTPWLQQGD